MKMISGHTPQTRPSTSPSSSWRVSRTVVAPLLPPLPPHGSPSSATAAQILGPITLWSPSSCSARRLRAGWGGKREHGPPRGPEFTASGMTREVFGPLKPGTRLRRRPPAPTRPSFPRAVGPQRSSPHTRRRQRRGTRTRSGAARRSARPSMARTARGGTAMAALAASVGVLAALAGARGARPAGVAPAPGALGTDWAPCPGFEGEVTIESVDVTPSPVEMGKTLSLDVTGQSGERPAPPPSLPPPLRCSLPRLPPTPGTPRPRGAPRGRPRLVLPSRALTGARGPPQRYQRR